MIDKTPYIIVDNRKISPIERSPQSTAATGDRHAREGQTFGVVDRVTISNEARVRSRLHQAPIDAIPEPLDAIRQKLPTTSPLLTYAPNRLRP